MHHERSIDLLIKPLVAARVRGPTGRRRAVPFFGLVIAACWTQPPRSGQNRAVVLEDPPAQQLEATVRVDAAPSAKHFQGVWLELADGARWVIDYRATEIWRGFADQAVTVTGHRWEPQGQAIHATHFRVATMRFAAPPSHAVPYRSIGPVQLLRGSFVEHVWPAGTRRAGDVEQQFRTDDGDSYDLAGGPTEAGPVAITARVVEPDPSFSATTGAPKLFVIRVHPHDYTPAPGMR